MGIRKKFSIEFLALNFNFRSFKFSVKSTIEFGKGETQQELFRGGLSKKGSQ